MIQSFNFQLFGILPLHIERIVDLTIAKLLFRSAFKFVHRLNEEQGARSMMEQTNDAEKDRFLLYKRLRCIELRARYTHVCTLCNLGKTESFVLNFALLAEK